MKKTILTAAAIIAVVGASAQVSAFRQGSSASVEGYSLPRTVLTVKVTQQRDIVLRGPYARYASQYLGIVTAPMSDKESCRIVSASVGFYEEPDPKQLFVLDDKAGVPMRIFNWLPVQDSQNETQITRTNDIDVVVPFKNLGADLTASSRMSAIEKSQEQLAADAAEVIYRLRRKRLDVITGEVGDAVYGAGLKAALEEMDRIEAEYMALFIGKRITETTVKYINVVPEAGKNRITACRFSDTKGIVAENDMSGRPINLEFVSENISNNLAAPITKKATRWVTYRIPQMSVVKLTDGTEVLATQRVPIYQAGVAADMPVVMGQ